MTLSDRIREILEDVMDEVMLENPKYIDDAIKDIKLAVLDELPEKDEYDLRYWNDCVDEITGRLK